MFTIRITSSTSPKLELLQRQILRDLQYHCDIETISAYCGSVLELASRHSYHGRVVALPPAGEAAPGNHESETD